MCISKRGAFCFVLKLDEFIVPLLLNRVAGFYRRATVGEESVALAYFEIIGRNAVFKLVYQIFSDGKSESGIMFGSSI